VPAGTVHDALQWAAASLRRAPTTGAIRDSGPMAGELRRRRPTALNRVSFAAPAGAPGLQRKSRETVCSPASSAL